MPTDRYTKSVLTVIAASLVVLTAQNATRSATAQQPAPVCAIMTPCYVVNTGLAPLNIVDARAAPTPNERLRNLPPNSGQPR